MNLNNPLNLNKPYGKKVDSIYQEAYDSFEGNEAEAQEYAHEETCGWIIENPITTWINKDKQYYKNIGSDIWAHGLQAKDTKQFYTLTMKQYKWVKKGWKEIDDSYTESCIKAHDDMVAEFERDLDWRDGQ